MKKRHKLLLITVAILIGMLLVPWKPWLAREIKSELTARGFDVDFAIDAMSPGQITFKDIRFGPLHLQSLGIDYSPLELLKGNVRALHAADMVVKQGQLSAMLGDVEASITPAANGNGGSGTWKISAIAIAGAPLDVPALQGAGTIAVTRDKIKIDGVLKSADSSYKALFNVDAPLASDKAKLVITSVVMPWNEGTLRSSDIVVPLYGNAPIAVKLEMQHVSVNALMQVATGNRAAASGTMSGALPVLIRRDGSFSVEQGSFSADGGGAIILPPDVIPGDNAQVALLRDVLKDFHYSVLSLGVDSGKDNKLSMLLSLQGNNPDVYNGREVKLNVHLTGDLLDLLTQGLMPINDPQQLLKQEHK